VNYRVTLTNIRDEHDTVGGYGDTLADAIEWAVENWYDARPGYKESGNKPPSFVVSEIGVSP
jgi:hypothetical protein